MSTAIPLLVVIALAAAIALCGVGIWAAIEVAKTARSSRRLAEDLDERVPPLADKLDVSVDAFNAELLRVDIIVDQLEGAVNRFAGTADTVREVVDAPIHLVSEVADRVRHGFRRRGSHARRDAQARPPGGEQTSEVVLLDTPGGFDDEVPDAMLLSGQGDDIPSVVQLEPELSADEPEPVEIEPAVLEPTDSVTPSTHEPEEA